MVAFNATQAHLVAKGFQQNSSLDYFETFNPIINPLTIRVIFSVVVTYH